MDVSGGMVRVQDKSLDVGRAEMEDARFMMINPNHRVIVMLVHSEFL